MVPIVHLVYRLMISVSLVPEEESTEIAVNSASDLRDDQNVSKKFSFLLINSLICGSTRIEVSRENMVVGFYLHSLNNVSSSVVDA